MKVKNKSFLKLNRLEIFIFQQTIKILDKIIVKFYDDLDIDINCFESAKTELYNLLYINQDKININNYYEKA